MNIQGLLIGLVVWFASLVGAYFYGNGVGHDAEIAKNAAIEKAIVDTRAAAMLGAADAIAKIKITNRTIQGKVETVIRDNPVYRDCKHSDDALRLLNEAIQGKPGTGSTGGGSLPRTLSLE